MRRFINIAIPAAGAICTLIALAVLAGIVISITTRGWTAIRWSFFAEQIRLVGAEGGILFNLIGTLILAGTALLFAAPVSIGLALVHGVYLQSSRWKRGLTLALHVLNGMPSILFGIIGLIVFVKFLGWGKSWLAGGIVLAAMIVPTVTVALVERIAHLPARYIEAAAGLGLDQSQIIRAVILPQCIGGVVTGSLLGLARAAGETAPIMFTAAVFAGATVPHGIKDSPVLSLPYHIFNLAQDSFDADVTSKLWGSALVLVALVFCFSLAALPARLRMHEESRHD